MNKSCSKICFKLSLGQILFICIDHLSKNRFLPKLSKNGRFLLNKVKKIIRDQNFFHKIKIAQNVGFPHRFSFSGQKVTPMGLPDASGPPLAFGLFSTGQDGSGKSTNDFLGSFQVPSRVPECAFGISRLLYILDPAQCSHYFCDNHLYMNCKFE